MAKFIKVTRVFDINKYSYINVENIELISDNDQGGTNIFFMGSSLPVTIKETPEKIMQLIKEA